MINNGMVLVRIQISEVQKVQFHKPVFLHGEYSLFVGSSWRFPHDVSHSCCTFCLIVLPNINKGHLRVLQKPELFVLFVVSPGRGRAGETALSAPGLSQESATGGG